MPQQTIARTATSYALIAFDKNGVERPDRQGIDGKMTARVIEDAARGGVTNIFFFSHGWKGDVPAAIDQYDRWIGAVDGLEADRERMRTHIPDFKPMYVGLHWPSQPWGDEELSASGTAFEAAPASGVLVDLCAARLGDTPQIRSAVETIVDEARRHADAQTLTPRARDAYIQLDSALALGGEGVGGTPASDREPFDPDRAMAEGQSMAPEFGVPVLGGILGPLRQLSFWTMKKRGQMIGEGGMHTFLKSLLDAAPRTRVHLMGHSFGCVVVSSMLAGPNGAGSLPRAVSSCVLVQGAMSLWSYSGDIPVARGRTGYCHRVLADKRVHGPIVTTRSRFDRAVGLFYPLAAGAANQVTFAETGFPTYGGTGAFGLQGIAGITDLQMTSAASTYDFRQGGVYNVESSNFIKKGGGASGAHSDIDGPEVAHAIWSAAISS